jgi:hypothetical protein
MEQVKNNSFSFDLVETDGQTTRISIHECLTEIEVAALRFLFSFDINSRSIFMGIEVAKEVGADPSAFVAVVDALSAALEPVFESPDEDEQALSNTERQLEVCG